MDEKFLTSLEHALMASPDNLTLRLTLVKACFELKQPQKAFELLSAIEAEPFMQVEENLLAADVCLANGEAARALSYLTQQAPQVKLRQAKAYVLLDDFDNARACYKAAVAENASLEDVALAQQLSLEAETAEPDRRVKLRVISNDNADDIEVTRLLEPAGTAITFADVGGLEPVKKQIRKKIITPFQKPSLFNRFKKKIGGGILMYGPPGCGKTLLAKATAGECNAQFINVVISDILDMYIGESERKLHAIFEQARRQTPAVIFFDEIEALAAKRQHSREATSAKLVSQFLSELDGFAQNNEGVLVIGATNVPWAIDPAFRRPGRFDRVVFVEPPDRDARLEILKGLVKDRPGAENIDVSWVAKTTSGFSGADLMHLIETAVDEAIEHSINEGVEVPIRQQHVVEALKEVKPTTLEWLTMARNYARYANDAGQYDDVLAFLKKHGG